MTLLSRRSFGQQSLAALLTCSLLETICQRDLWGDEVRPLATKWLADLNQLGQDLKGEKLSQLEWQAQVEELYKQIDLADVLNLLDFDRLASEAKLVDTGALSMRCKFPEIEGVPRELVFGRQIFGLKPGRSVVPHGHSNMATAFLVLRGQLQGRHYDRLEDEPEHFIIRPTIDRKFGPGECSTISDFKDNVHWFQALDKPAFIFNIHVLEAQPNSSLPTGRLYLDPKGEALSEGRIRARRLDYEEAHRLYG